MSTSWVGVGDRIQVGAFLLWIVVLAIALLRIRDTAAVTGRQWESLATGSRRLTEKGLEAERQRIDEEIAEIKKQIRGGSQSSRNQARPQSQANPQPQSVARPAGREAD